MTKAFELKKAHTHAWCMRQPLPTKPLLGPP